MRLLAAAATSWPGNIRYALLGGEVYRLGELRDADDLLAWPAAEQRLLDGAYDASHEVCPGELACLLAETGHEWSQPEDTPDTWQAVADDPHGERFALTAPIVAGGVEVYSPLGDGDTPLGAASEVAAARFLAAAQARVRFARFVLEDGRVRAVSWAAADRLEIELPDSVSAVVAACRLVGRELRALADETVAAAYLEAHP
jgi:hypothetical protein